MADDAHKLNGTIYGWALSSTRSRTWTSSWKRYCLRPGTFVNADGGSIQIRDGDELIFSHVQTDFPPAGSFPPGKKLIYTTFRTKINRDSISGYVADTGELLNLPDAYGIPKSGAVPVQFRL